MTETECVARYGPLTPRQMSMCLGTSGLSREAEEATLRAIEAFRRGEEPGWFEKGVGLATAVFTHVRMGLNTVSEETHDERLDVCRTCDMLNKETWSCRLCGCHMNFKAWMAEVACPAGKWGPATLAGQGPAPSDSATP